MMKKIFVMLAVLTLLTVVGCSSSSATTAATTTPAAGVKQVRQAVLNETWAVKQLEIELDAAISIMLTLSAGDKVEGFFYLEKGNGLTFQITGESLIYESQPADEDTEFVTSDRFSFTASNSQGKAYTLKLTAAGAGKTAAKTAAPVFLEIVYPVTGEIFVPMGTK